MLQEQSWCLQHIASKQSQCSKKVNHSGAGAMDQQHSARTSLRIHKLPVFLSDNLLLGTLTQNKSVFPDIKD